MPKQNDEDTILLRLANLAKKHTEFIKDNQNKVYAKIEINGILKKEKCYSDLLPPVYVWQLCFREYGHVSDTFTD